MEVAEELISVLEDWKKKHEDLKNQSFRVVQKMHRGQKKLEEELKNQYLSVATIQEEMHDAEVEFLKSVVGGSEEWKERHENFLKLKDLVYDVEDLLDRSISLTSQIQHEDHFVASRLYCIRAFHEQTQIDEQGSNRLVARISSKVCKFLTSSYDILPLTNIRTDKIDKLKTRIKSWREEVSDSLGRRVRRKSFPVRLVFGREADKLRIIDKLCLSDEEIEQDSPVISIVGPGGIGKTTLAQLVACDEKVREYFDFRMWVPLGDRKVANFDAERVSKLILESANFTSFNGSDPSQLLQEFVTGKKIFLVLDDVRAVDVDRLLPWIKTLQTRLKGCRILITTRSENVRKKLGTHETYLLQPLDKTANWALCKSLATWVDGKDETWKDQTFSKERIKREIFKKTGGFPLLAKAWGGILLLEDTKGGWDSILECEIWDASRYGMWQQKPQHNVWELVLRTLESSYADLPAHLKRCFKSFSLFPKGCWMDKEVLTQLWMAEGFINRDDAEKIKTGEEIKLKETVGKYFDDLLSRTSFFKDIEKDDDSNILRCKMYEPLHDIVRYIAKDECSVMTDGTFKGLPLTERTRYSSLHFIEKTEPILSSLNKASKMRTVLCFGNPSCLKVPGGFFTHLEFLRALDLSLPVIEDLPDSVGKLKQLRYLNLSYTRIKKLPPFICDLYLLQTLKLSHSQLDELPKEISKLQKLRHLEIDGTPMDDLPYEIGKLNAMCMLSEFIVGGESSIGVLGNLTLLQGNLIISNMERIANMDDAKNAKLKKKEGIVSLVLDGKKHLCSQNSDCRRHCSSLLLMRMCEDMVSKTCSDRRVLKKIEGVFDGIKPHENLKRLEIWNYIGMKFPEWLGDKSLKILVSLKLVKCFNVEHLPCLDLPSLKFLHICRMDKIQTVDCCALKGFPKLEKLFLENMPRWEEWNLETMEGKSFKELILSNCPSLKALPALPVSLRKLMIHDCPAQCIRPLPPLEYLVLKGNVDILHSLPDIPQLESLTIAYSQESSLPSKLHQFKALRTLNINFCPKLNSLPDVLRRLTRLQEIRMVGCRLLTEQFQEGKGDWSMIDHVAVKEIDNKKFFAPEPTSDKLPSFTSKPALLYKRYDIDDQQ